MSGRGLSVHRVRSDRPNTEPSREIAALAEAVRLNGRVHNLGCLVAGVAMVCMTSGAARAEPGAILVLGNGGPVDLGVEPTKADEVRATQVDLGPDGNGLTLQVASATKT